MAPDGFGGVYSAKLTDNADTDNLPARNAEGTRIAFVSNREEGVGTLDADIYRMDASGNGETQLTSNSVEDTSPAWFPTDTSSPS
ncbi:MAG TPA: hypothetical protein VF068_12235 [Rubrobacter sp.]